MSEEVARLCASKEKAHELNSWAKVQGFKQQKAVDVVIEAGLKALAKKTKN